MNVLSDIYPPPRNRRLDDLASSSVGDTTVVSPLVIDLDLAVQTVPLVKQFTMQRTPPLHASTRHSFEAV
jgi:hypothetical protein